MSKQDKPSSPAPVNRLVGPHLRLRWEKSDQPDIDWLCHYELVIPFDEHDIRREVYDKNGELVAERFCNVISMGSTTKRTSSHPPCHGNVFDAPFRDYAHAKWDAMKLGDLPIYVIAPDGKAYLRPNVGDHRAGPKEYCKAGKIIMAGSGASTCWADCIWLKTSRIIKRKTGQILFSALKSSVMSIHRWRLRV